jgi:hypothetical protein
MERETDSLLRWMLLAVVCDRKESQKMTGVFKGQNTSFNLMTFGKGTASSKILHYLGLGQTEKTLLLSAMSAGEAENILSKLNEALDLKQPGHGIAFTLPLDGPYTNDATKTIPEGNEVARMSQENQENEKEGMPRQLPRYEHALILAVANRGYSQEVMDAARSAGATGGTIIHARGTAPAGTEKFFGVTIQPEKEIVMILALIERQNDIMRAIVEKNGVGTPASAIAFSMPVCGVEGLLSLQPQMNAEKRETH